MVSDKVVTEEDSKSRDYEMVFIVSPEATEEKFGTTVDNISRFITDRGGVVSGMEQWGKKRLAYPIRHFTEGNYVLARFKMEPPVGKELEANLRISEDILRHLLVRLDD